MIIYALRARKNTERRIIDFGSYFLPVAHLTVQILAIFDFDAPAFPICHYE